MNFELDLKEFSDQKKKNLYGFVMASFLLPLAIFMSFYFSQNDDASFNFYYYVMIPSFVMISHFLGLYFLTKKYKHWGLDFPKASYLLFVFFIFLYFCWSMVLLYLQNIIAYSIAFQFCPFVALLMTKRNLNLKETLIFSSFLFGAFSTQWLLFGVEFGESEKIFVYFFPLFSFWVGWMNQRALKVKENLKEIRELAEKWEIYAKNLEDKVSDTTKKVKGEKEKFYNLLNNMKQVAFSIDEKLKVVGPVPTSTNDIFGFDIEGKSILETLYKNVNRQSEEFSRLKSAFYVAFGKDELQFLMVEDHFLQKIEFRKLTDGSEEEILFFSISYHPLWNHEGNLEHIMFIIKDITAKEKLHQKVELEKKVHAKNILIIEEIGHLDFEDMTQFLQIAPKFVEEAMTLAKKAPLDINALIEIFRSLHTLKGHSMMYGFVSISNIIHITEYFLTEIKESIRKGKEVGPDDFKPIISNLYEVYSEINRYAHLAKKVFRIENTFENKMIKNIKNITVHLEQIISKKITSKGYLLYQNQSKKNRQKVFKEFQERTIGEEILPKMKRYTHSLKGHLKSIGQQEDSEIVHRFEDSFIHLKEIKEMTTEAFCDDFIGHFIKIKDRSRLLYQHSDLNIPYTKNTDDWSEIFKNFFYFSKGIEQIFETDDFLIKLETLIFDCGNLNLQFLAHVFDHFFWVISSGPKKILEHKERMTIQIRELWLYFSLVGRLDYTQMRALDHDDRFYHEMKTLGENRSHLKEFLDKITSHSILVKALKKISSSGEDPNEFFLEAEKHILQEGDQDVFDYFINPDEMLRPDLKLILEEFKNTVIVNRLPDVIRGLAEENDPVAFLLVELFGKKSDFLYLKSLDFPQLLNGFYTDKRAKDKTHEVIKVEIVPVVMRNLKGLNKAVLDGQLDKIKMATQRLTDVPVIPSLQKFKFMIQSVSIQLNKNVDFSVSGDEVTLSKEAIDILQDAFIHILRNAMIHGIEDDVARRKRGKNPEGVITVFCYGQEQDSIEIRISDDGRGIDPKVIKRKALEKDIYSQEELDNMNEAEVLDIIFHPNFSQKDQVDEFAGRGIGMDIVRKNIERLGGVVTVKSILGKGTEFLLLIKSSFEA